MSTFTERWGKWVVPYAALWITMLVGGAIVVVLALLGAEVYDERRGRGGTGEPGQTGPGPVTRTCARLS